MPGMINLASNLMVGDLTSSVGINQAFTFINLLNGHSLKLPSKSIILYLWISVALRPQQRSCSVQEMRVNTETQNQSKC